MEPNPGVVVEVNLRPNDVYTPFQWERGNLARWVTSIVLCLIFYDLYRSSRATILSFQGGESILAIIALLVLFILLGLLLFPYLRLRAMFRSILRWQKLDAIPSAQQESRFSLMMQLAIANGLCLRGLMKRRASSFFL